MIFKSDTFIKVIFIFSLLVLLSVKSVKAQCEMCQQSCYASSIPGGGPCGGAWYYCITKYAGLGGGCGQPPCGGDTELVCGCGECSGWGCFTADTKIATLSFDDAQDKGGDPSASSGQGNPSINSGQVEIKDIKEGDVVKSFNPKTGEIKEATVTATHKRQVSGYYILKTESGREIKVTGEHPILAVKQEKVGKVAQVEKVGKEIISFFNGIWGKIKGVVK